VKWVNYFWTFFLQMTHLFQDEESIKEGWLKYIIDF